MTNFRRLTFLIFFIKLTLMSSKNVHAQTEIKQIIVGEELIEFSNPGYPDYAKENTDIKWMLHTNHNEAKIEVLCRDFRLSKTDPCIDYISIDDGNTERKLCGSHSGITLTSKERSINIYLHIGPRSTGALHCQTKLLIPVIATEITLKLRDPAYYLATPKKMPSDFDKRWIFRTEPGLRLSLTCSDFRFVDANPCLMGFEIDNGEAPKIYCGSRSGLQIFSHRQEIKVKLFTGYYSGGEAKCTIEAVNGPSHLQYENEETKEMDSSEHGVRQGRVSTTCPCGWTNKNVGRIFNGHESGINEYPWIVAIRESLKPGDTPPAFHFCGGSIITHYHVLSAAHCVYYRMDEELYAVVGEHNIRSSAETKATQSHKIVQKIIPEGYIYEEQHLDIAILVVETPIVFNQFVGPICLTPDRLKVAYKHLLVLGWGLTDAGRSSDHLQKVYVRAIDLNVCASNWGFLRGMVDEPHKVCTDSRKRDYCMGDSGGPLAILDEETNRYKQVSLVSFGAGCNIGKPSVSTEIFPFYDWILKKIKETYPEEVICSTPSLS